jgi:hypothetical protein
VAAASPALRWVITDVRVYRERYQSQAKMGGGRNPMSQKWSVLRIGFLITLLVCGTAAAADEFTPATYSATAGTVEWTLQYHEGGRVTVSRNGEVVIEGKYKVAGDALEVVDEKGSMACPAAQTGKYTWKLEEKKLTLTKVEDECEGRSSAFTRLSWTRR